MIARNRAVDFHRQRRDAVELPADLAAHDDTAERADAMRLLAIVQALPEAYRETLVLRLVEGHDGPEIAARTGLTAGVSAGQPPSRHEDAAREARTMTDHEPDAPTTTSGTAPGCQTRRSCGSRKRSGRCAIEARFRSLPNRTPVRRRARLDICALAGRRRGPGAAGRRVGSRRACAAARGGA